ncbi:MAG: hypothetical protein EF813_00935 [Methanosarcinales archaeon]|nr:MAG: hypothetical protein EF813_00935 [Methanosarcinales archaeon]
MNKANKKHITGLITIIAIVAVLISAGCIGDDGSSAPASTPTRTAAQPIVPAPAAMTESGTLSVSELLESPVYDTEVKVYGTVSAVG